MAKKQRFPPFRNVWEGIAASIALGLICWIAGAALDVSWVPSLQAYQILFTGLVAISAALFARADTVLRLAEDRARAANERRARDLTLLWNALEALKFVRRRTISHDNLLSSREPPVFRGHRKTSAEVFGLSPLPSALDDAIDNLGRLPPDVIQPLFDIRKAIFMIDDILAEDTDATLVSTGKGAGALEPDIFTIDEVLAEYKEATLVSAGWDAGPWKPNVADMLRHRVSLSHTVIFMNCDRAIAELKHDIDALLKS